MIIFLRLAIRRKQNNRIHIYTYSLNFKVGYTNLSHHFKPRTSQSIDVF